MVLRWAASRARASELRYNGGSERPAAYSQQKLTQVPQSPGISLFSRCYVIAPLIPTFLIDGPRNRAQVTYGANLGKPIVPIV